MSYLDGMIPLLSSWLAAAGYYRDTLRVVLHNGQVYDHPHVPHELFQGLIYAESPGAFYNEHIRGQF
jgi:hypothetical protein